MMECALWALNAGRISERRKKMDKKPGKVIVITEREMQMLKIIITALIKGAVLSMFMISVWALLRIQVDGNARMYRADVVLIICFSVCCNFMMIYKHMNAAEGKGITCSTCRYKNAVDNAPVIRIHMQGKPGHLADKNVFPAGVCIEEETIQDGMESVWLRMRVLDDDVPPGGYGNGDNT